MKPQSTLRFLATCLLLAIALALPDLSAFEGQCRSVSPASYQGSGISFSPANQVFGPAPTEEGLYDDAKSSPPAMAVLEGSGFAFSTVSLLQSASSGQNKRQANKNHSSDDAGMAGCPRPKPGIHANSAYFLSLFLHHCPDKRDATGKGPDDPRAGPSA